LTCIAEGRRLPRVREVAIRVVRMLTGVLVSLAMHAPLGANPPASPEAGVFTSMHHKGSTMLSIDLRLDLVASSSRPPRSTGYFALRPQGSWSSLPSGRQCKKRVHYSTWEPRKQNAVPNHTIPNATAVAASLSARPRSTRGGTYAKRWDSWLLPRVRGGFAGTTDEIFQWAACKWGLRDNMLRGIAVRESTWFQYETYPSGRCVLNYGCGDMFSSSTQPSKIYCDGLTAVGTYDYQADFGSGICPKTFSIAGVMSWDDPAWEAPFPAWKDNQNGTFPFNRNSTAFAVDYLASYLRGCYEGWVKWLRPEGGDIWGCVGSWYSGDWRSSRANGYVRRVKNEILNHTWLDPGFARITPGCDPTYGCPN
jgi:hypothetical protein